MKIIEKVARAIARNQLTTLGKEAFDRNEKYYTESFSKEHRDSFEAQARIAIEAMKMPLAKIMQDEGIDVNTASSVVYAIDTALKE